MKKYIVTMKNGMEHLINATNLHQAIRQAIWMSGASNNSACEIVQIKTVKIGG